MRPPQPRPDPEPPRVAPAAVVRQARIEAAADQAVVVANSSNRLAKLKWSSAAVRLAALEDADLIPADRKRLRASLQADLRRPFGHWIMPRRWLSSLRGKLVRWRGPGIGIAALGLAFGFAATRNAEPAILKEAVPVTLHFPNGTSRSGVLPAGPRILVRHLDAHRVEARQWRSGEGYLTAILPLSSLRFER